MATVLDFSTAPTETAHVAIDGVLYPILHPDQLSIAQIKRMEREAPELGRLMQLDELTPEQEAEIDRLLQSACATVLEAPEDVRARLSDAQRIAVIEAFTQLRTAKPQATGAMRAASRSTGANTSPDSNGSTAATRRGGTRASR